VHVRPGAVWAFDVDGTLVGSVRSDVLRPGVLELLQALGRRTVVCVVWSAGGAAHARRMATVHGFHHLVTEFYGKDGRDGDARYVTHHFDDDHRPHVFVDDAPQDLPVGAIVIAVPQFIGGNPADRALTSLAAAIDA
jgi:phosphoglycolate phosphatase-like HAD superfamily hydrolase